VEYFNCLCSGIANDARYTREIEFRIVTAKVTFGKKEKTHFTSRLDLNLMGAIPLCDKIEIYIYIYIYTG